jgi:phenylalanyl-tRNA synthetase beta chain
VTWSFISEAEAAAFGGSEWRLANPISEDMKVMRPSLLPGLIAAARRNLDRGATSVRLFEVGRRYLGDCEHPTLSLLLAGERRTREWQSGKGASLRRIRREGGSRRLARGGGSAGRQSAGLRRRRSDMASRPVGYASARSQDRGCRLR